jgi:hypothetical protein
METEGLQMNRRASLLQSLRCQLLGHQWSVWRKVTRKNELFRLCSNCDKRETKLMTPDEIRAHETRSKRTIKSNTEPTAKKSPTAMSIDQAVAYCGLPQSNELHWALGQIAALEWDRKNGARVFEIRPKTDPHARVPAGHFKRVYPFSFIVPLVMQQHEFASRQLSFAEVLSP